MSERTRQHEEGESLWHEHRDGTQHEHQHEHPIVEEQDTGVLNDKGERIVLAFVDTDHDHEHEHDGIEEGGVTDDCNTLEAGREAGYTYALDILKQVDERQALADLKRDRGGMPDYSEALAKAEQDPSFAVLIPELERMNAKGYGADYLVGFSEGFGEGARHIRS